VTSAGDKGPARSERVLAPKKLRGLLGLLKRVVGMAKRSDG